MNFADYYHTSFRDDLSEFMRGRSAPYFGHAWRIGCPDLERVHAPTRPAFVVGLYFTVLMDQAMHAHFSSLHARFEQLTRSPKFCHGLGQFHLNPRAILSAPIEHGLVGQEEVLKHLAEGMRTLVSDMASLLRDHLPEIPPESFFNALVSDPDVQIPLLIVMIDESVAESPAFKAYEALRHSLSQQVVHADIRSTISSAREPTTPKPNSKMETSNDSPSPKASLPSPPRLPMDNGEDWNGEKEYLEQSDEAMMLNLHQESPDEFRNDQERDE